VQFIYINLGSAYSLEPYLVSQIIYLTSIDFLLINKIEGVVDMWFRYIMIGFLSLTAIQMFAFQAVYIFQAFAEYFNNK
jgi:hypothetical protein